MDRQTRLERAVYAASESLWPFTLAVIGLPGLLSGLINGQNAWNLRTFAGIVRHEFNKTGEKDAQ